MRPHPTPEDASPEVPWLSLVFGFGPMLPLVAGALAVWLLADVRDLALDLTLLWAAAILTFLSGVRRGLSFRTVGGPTLAQMLTMMGLFCLGLGAFAALHFDRPSLATGLLLVGYAGIVILDPIAAHRGEAPLHFARLRPMQIPLALLSLAALLAMQWSGIV